MAQSVLEMAKDLVMAQIAAKALSPENMQQELHKTYGSLMALKRQEEAGISPGSDGAAVQKPGGWRQSITKHTIACLECGATFKQLSSVHLREHELDPRTYRAKYGIPRTQALAARDTTIQRKKIVQRTRPWEKAPTYRKAHGEQAPKKAPAKAERKAAAKAKRVRRRTAAGV